MGTGLSLGVVERPTQEDMERYLDRCQTLLVRLDGLLPASAIGEAQHLLDHGEPSIGVEVVAHAVVGQGLPLPAALVDEMRALVLDEGDLPPDLDEYRRE
jgi:hypothetical protein